MAASVEEAAMPTDEDALAELRQAIAALQQRLKALEDREEAKRVLPIDPRHPFNTRGASGPRQA